MLRKLKLKHTIIIIFVLITLIYTCQCTWHNGRWMPYGQYSGNPNRWGTFSFGGSVYPRTSSSSGSGKGWSLFSSSGNTESSTGSSVGKWFSSLFSSSGKNESSSEPPPHSSDSYVPVITYVHPNEPLPGGVKPPPGVKQPYGPLPVYTRTNIYPNRSSPEPENPGKSSQTHVSGYNTFGSKAHLPPPPPPPGFILTRTSKGAAPSYTYYMNDFLSRGANSGLTAGLALWELSKHRSHYRVYHTVNHETSTNVVEVSKNEEFKPGGTYIIMPTDVKCRFVVNGFKSPITIVTMCDADKNLEFDIVLPSNQTTGMFCYESSGIICTSSKSFSEGDMTPVDYEIFNETAVYGAPLCNTTVISGGLEIDHEQYKKGVPPCVYPPYKWTGEEWINVEEKIQKEKIKENLNSVYNVTKFEDKTLNTLARSMPFGKFFGMFYNTTK